MWRRFSAVWVAGGVLLAACRTVPPRGEVPAVIADPTPHSRGVLAEAVRQALGGTPVTLADDALTRTDSLIIERQHPRDPGGIPLDGRQRGMPERFQLVKSDDRCVLIHGRTGRRFPLAGVACSQLGEGR